MRTQQVVSRVLRKIKPSRLQEKTIQDFAKHVVKIANDIGAPDPMLCGSVGKGTWLTDKAEIDMFLLFPEHTSRDELENDGLRLAKRIIDKIHGKYEIAYAEHPYLRGKARFRKKSFSIDIVPCFNVADPSRIKSAVDRTPHHVHYIHDHFTDQLANEARLLKAFMKSARCYGADIKTQGFSGYLCELLIIKYGSFLDVITAAIESWTPGQMVDLENHYMDHGKSFARHAPLIVIDPVDPKRNVAAAVSPESFFKLVKASAEFLRNPHEKYFFPREVKPLSAREMEKLIISRGTDLFIVKFKRPEVVDDILWAQLRKVSATLERWLKGRDFQVMRRSEWADEDDCIIILELDVWEVPKVVLREGPSIFSAKQVRAFEAHYKGKRIQVIGDKKFVELEREFTYALRYIVQALRSPKKTLLEKGIPNKLTEIKNAQIMDGKDAIKLAMKMKKDFRSFMREYFEKDLRV